ncbi:MAG: SLOG family protein [Cyanobacteriota bacterium]|nr:SLOG family protein [Cyanobacteriota bacterium]
MVSLHPAAASCGPEPPLCLLPAVFSCDGPSPSIIRALIIVAGGGRSLDWSPLRIATALQTQVAGRLVHRLLHGGARGADQAIAAAAAQLGWPAEEIPAQWARYGVAAGPIRNAQMLRRAIELAAAQPQATPTAVAVIAFPGAQGTASLLAKAKQLQARTSLPLEITQISG